MKRHQCLRCAKWIRDEGNYCEKCNNLKYKVREVPSKMLGDYLGMNPEAARAMGFKKIKAGEVLVNNRLSPRNKRRVVKHEITEANLMRKGMSYWVADKIARSQEVP